MAKAWLLARKLKAHGKMPKDLRFRRSLTSVSFYLLSRMLQQPARS
jgi:hypothetical protein